MKPLTHSWLLFPVIFLLLPITAEGQVYTGSEGLVQFTSRAPLLTFTGTSNHLTGFINTETGEVDFFVDLGTLDTGNRRRDRDMRQVYLETEKYPFAEFTGRLSSVLESGIMDKQPVTVTGLFTMREISREVEITGTIEITGEGLKVEADWEVLLSDYNIDRPRIVFYELSEVQKVSIKIQLKPEN
jgi:polyisoprenoid-binding protein YceI